MDLSPKKFRELVLQSTEMIESWYANNIRGVKIYENKKPHQIQKAFKLNIKNKPCAPEKVIKHLDDNLIKYSNFNPSPNYYGYITGGGNQVGAIAELIKGSLNQNNLKWHSAPANTEIEKLTIE